MWQRLPARPRCGGYTGEFWDLAQFSGEPWPRPLSAGSCLPTAQPLFCPAGNGPEQRQPAENVYFPNLYRRLG